MSRFARRLWEARGCRTGADLYATRLYCNSFLQVIAEDELAAHLNPHRLRLATLNPSDALLRSLLTRIELRWSSTLDWVLIGVLGSLCKSFGVRLVKKSSQG